MEKKEILYPPQSKQTVSSIVTRTLSHIPQQVILQEAILQEVILLQEQKLRNNMMHFHNSPGSSPNALLLCCFGGVVQCVANKIAFNISSRFAPAR